MVLRKRTPHSQRKKTNNKNKNDHQDQGGNTTTQEQDQRQQQQGMDNNANAETTSTTATTATPFPAAPPPQNKKKKLTPATASSATTATTANTTNAANAAQHYFRNLNTMNLKHNNHSHSSNTSVYHTQQQQQRQEGPKTPFPELQTIAQQILPTKKKSLQDQLQQQDQQQQEEQPAKSSPQQQQQQKQALLTSKNSRRNKDLSNANTNDKNSNSNNNSTNTLSQDNQDFVNMIRDFLWQEYHNQDKNSSNEDVEKANGNGTTTAQTATGAATGAAKRKKKKRKKKKQQQQQQQQQSKEEDGDNDNGNDNDQQEPEPEHEQKDEQDTATASSATNNVIQDQASAALLTQLIDDKIHGLLFAPGEEPQQPSQKGHQQGPGNLNSQGQSERNNSNNQTNQNTQQNTTQTSVLQTSFDDNDDSDEGPRSSWWISYYLDQCEPETMQTSATSDDKEPAPTRYTIAQFLQFLEKRAAATVPARKGGNISNNSNNGNNNSKQNQQQQQQQNAASALSSCMIRQSDVQQLLQQEQQKLRGAEQAHFAVQSSSAARAHQFFSSSSAVDEIPLPPSWQDLMTQQQEQHLQTYSAHIVDDQEEEDPFDYVAMEEGNAVVPNNNTNRENQTATTWMHRNGNDEPQNNAANADKSTDEQRASPLLCLRAVRTAQGETLGWRLEKKDNVDNGASKETAPLTEKDFATLLEYWLSPGLLYDEWVAAASDANLLTADIIGRIEEQVKEEHYDIMTNVLTAHYEELHELKNLLLDCDSEEERQDPDAGGISLSFDKDGKNKGGLSLLSPIKLLEIDKNLGDIMESLLRRLLLPLTRYYQEIMLQWNGSLMPMATREKSSGSYPFPSKLLRSASCIVKLWQIYLDGFHRMIQGMAEFEANLFALPENEARGGSKRVNVKQMAFSSGHRRLFRTLMRGNIKACFDIIDQLRIQLDSQRDTYETPQKVYRPTFLRSILTQYMLLTVVRAQTTAGQTSNVCFPAKKSTEFDSLNHSCEHAVLELRDSWAYVVKKSAQAHYEEEYDQKRVRMLRLFNTANTLLGYYSKEQQDEALLSNIVAKQMSNSASEMASYLASISKDEVPLEKALVIMRQQATSVVLGMIQRWIIVSTSSPRAAVAKSTMESSSTNTSQSLADTRSKLGLEPKTTPSAVETTRDPEEDAGDRKSLTKPLMMPLRLIEWMVEPSHYSRFSSQSQALHGDSDGSIRATTLIMSLLYKWFMGQFREWQAELAEEELLSTMNLDGLLESDVAGAASQNPGVGQKKKSKKKKSKQQQKSPTSEPKESLEQPSSTGEAENLVHESTPQSTSLQQTTEDNSPMPVADGDFTTTSKKKKNKKNRRKKRDDQASSSVDEEEKLHTEKGKADNSEPSPITIVDDVASNAVVPVAHAEPLPAREVTTVHAVEEDANKTTTTITTTTQIITTTTTITTTTHVDNNLVSQKEQEEECTEPDANSRKAPIGASSEDTDDLTIQEKELSEVNDSAAELQTGEEPSTEDVAENSHDAKASPAPGSSSSDGNRVGVLDGSQFIPAEEFLLSRFWNATIAPQGRERSTNKNHPRGSSNRNRAILDLDDFEEVPLIHF